MFGKAADGEVGPEAPTDSSTLRRSSKVFTADVCHDTQVETSLEVEPSHVNWRGS